MLTVLAGTVKQENKMKGIQIGKEVKLSQFSDDMILHIRDPKNSTRKRLETAGQFSSVEEHRVDLHQSVVFLYTKSKQRKRSWTEYHSQ